MASNDFITFKNNLLTYLNVEKVYDFVGQIPCNKKGDFVVHRKVLRENIVDNLLDVSRNWPFKINILIRDPLYLRILLDRPVTIQKSMFSIFKEPTCSYGVIRNLEKKMLQICLDNIPDEISSTRFTMLKMVISNLAILNGYEVTCSSADSYHDGTKIFITHKSNSKIPDGYKRLICAKVINTNSKENEVITCKQYEMFIEKTLHIASGDFMSTKMLHDLIKPMITFQLLSVKHDKAVILNISDTNNRVYDNPVLYILYNLNRLDAIILQFDQKVIQKEYPPLPPCDKVNFVYLNKQKEWELMVNFIIPFPSVIQKSIENIADGNVRIHNVLSFMLCLSRAISSYYRASKILMDPLPELLPYVYARIYLVKALIKVLYTGLSATIGKESLENVTF